MCPFCYIGKRHFESALARFDNKDDIQITWKSFQLDPTIPKSFGEQVNVYQYLADRKGMSYEHSEKIHESVVHMAKEAGLDYHFDKAIIANSFNAHRVIQMAKQKGLGDQMEERFFHAYFTEGQDLGETTVLVALGKDIGLSEADVLEALNNDEYAKKVNGDIAEAQAIGIRAVPSFIFDRRYAVRGAQPTEVFLQALGRAVAEGKGD
jgi:protein disulfide-isomerase